MINQELVDYIKEHKATGKTDEQITFDLKKIGFKDSDIRLAYELLNAHKNSHSSSSVRGLVIRYIKIVILAVCLVALVLFSFYLYKKYYYKFVDFRYQYFIDVTENDNCINEALKITGSGKCAQTINGSLSLMKKKAPDYYNYVECYLGEIRCVDTGDMHFIYENGFPIMEADDEYSASYDENSYDTYAATIVHEATHAKLHYVEGMPSAGEEAELICNDLESEFLLKIGWPKKKVDEYRTRAIYNINK